MKKADMRNTVLREIKIWENVEKEQIKIKKDAQETKQYEKAERAFTEEIKYMSMKNAVALLAESLELITEEEKNEIMGRKQKP